MRENKERVTEATQSKTINNNTTRKPQWQVVLEELEKHKEDGITSWDMIDDHHITRTAAHICTLKKMGYTIRSESEQYFGQPAYHYSRYFLIDDDDEEDDDVCHDWVDEPYISEDRLERRAIYDAYGAWLSSRGW